MFLISYHTTWVWWIEAIDWFKQSEYREGQKKIYTFLCKLHSTVDISEVLYNDRLFLKIVYCHDDNIHCFDH